MTYDTEECNDPYKININLDDDTMNKRKEFYEKGLNALLVDPHFLLLYVPENGTKMQIIQPANDPHHRKRMIKRINEAKRIPSFYYALSHLWGLTGNNRFHWNDIGEYVDDEEGQPAKPVSMRPEKRDTLLALLKDHPDSYWWIDVLCARTDTPLDIMGDIYACCLECVAMIDCEPDLIPEINTMTDAVKQVDELREIIHRRKKRKHLTYKQVSQTTCPQLLNLLLRLTQKEWWKRVWTWQEMALPQGTVRLMSETGTHQPQSNTITLVDLLKFKPMAEFFDTTRIVDGDGGYLKAVANTVFTSLDEIRNGIESNYICIFDRSEHAFLSVISSLGFSKRRCTDPVDYVYGVLGVLQLKIPRMTDPHAVWQYFVSEMDKRLQSIGDSSRIAGHAHFDLRFANNMADVYYKFVEICYGI
ncbi:hypothetical protein K492DRAFT_240852 [Lichtheimia hyalospora FSU 10163]|nr:hypothetical protein K492DRAFT_240852 [Lichtheimia hyalospora FSU 10163]